MPHTLFPNPLRQYRNKWSVSMANNSACIKFSVSRKMKIWMIYALLVTAKILRRNTCFNWVHGDLMDKQQCWTHHPLTWRLSIIQIIIIIIIITIIMFRLFKKVCNSSQLEHSLRSLTSLWSAVLTLKQTLVFSWQNKPLGLLDLQSFGTWLYLQNIWHNRSHRFESCKQGLHLDTMVQFALVLSQNKAETEF